MILDMILAPLLDLANWLVALLPEAALVDVDGTALASVVGMLEKVNSIFPIGPALALAVGLLSALAAFVVIRAALTVWHIVWP